MISNQDNFSDMHNVYYKLSELCMLMCWAALGYCGIVRRYIGRESEKTVNFNGLRCFG